VVAKKLCKNPKEFGHGKEVVLLILFGIILIPRWLPWSAV
jgi:hypothetical protein